MAESAMRRRVLRALRPIDAVAIEDTIATGTPDVNHAFGWLELKWLPRWPTRPGTPVRFDTFTREQRMWLARRRRVGRADLLIQVGRDWLLIHGSLAAREVAGRFNPGCTTTREDLYRLSIGTWNADLDERELLECLSCCSTPEL